jgi:hypothetical protein
MESNQPSSILGEELSVTPGLHQSINSASTWARFIGIVTIICFAVFILAAVFARSFVVSLFSSQLPGGGADLLGGIILFVVLFVCAIGGLLIYFLMRFSNLTKKGIQLRNQAMFNDGLSALKTYFTIYGVLAVLALLFTAIGLFSAF